MQKMGSVGIVLLYALCIFCYTAQGFGARLYSQYYVGDTATASAVFSCIYGGTIALITFFMNGCGFVTNPAVWMLGVGNGLNVFLYNIGMVQAARRGPYAFQSLMLLYGGSVLSILFSVFYWGDSLTGRQLIGFFGMMVSLVLMSGGRIRIAGAKKGYLFFTIVLFITNGLFSVLMDAQHRVSPLQRNEMIIITFGTTAILSLGYLLIQKRGIALQAFRMPPKALLYSAVSSVPAAFAVFLLMFLMSYMSSFFIFPVKSSLIFSLKVILAAKILHERITRPMLAGVILSVVSIILTL